MPREHALRVDGLLARERVTAHLRHLAPQVKGFLILGSIGDGWGSSHLS